MVDTGYRRSWPGSLDELQILSTQSSCAYRVGIVPGLIEQHDIQSLFFLYVKDVISLVVSRLNIEQTERQRMRT